MMMRAPLIRFAVAFVLIGLTATAGRCCAAATASPGALGRTPTLAERAWIASGIYHVVKRYFAHWEGLPASFNWDARYRAYLTEALAAPDRKSFSLATTRLVASLNNGHTWFRDDALSVGQNLPFYARPVGGQWTVLVSRVADITSGDVIAAIDGQPIEQWLAPTETLIAASDGRARDRLAFLRPLVMPTSFTLTLADGGHVRVDRSAADGARHPPARSDTVEVTKRPNGTVIIRIPTFDDPKDESDAIAAVRANSTAPLILFDVRDNGGGNTPERLLAAIMDGPYAGTIVTTPMTIAEFDADGAFSPEDNPAPKPMLRYGPVVLQPTSDHARGRMAVLADGGCASACEDFVIRFKSGRRGPTLGEPTFGSTGQPFVLHWPEFGMQLRVSTKREYLPDGAPFEGVGVTPDIPVALTARDLIAVNDPQLERALAALKAYATR